MTAQSAKQRALMPLAAKPARRRNDVPVPLGHRAVLAFRPRVDPPLAAEPPSPDVVLRQLAPQLYNRVRRLADGDADVTSIVLMVLRQVLRKLVACGDADRFNTWLNRVSVAAALSQRKCGPRLARAFGDTAEPDAPGAASAPREVLRLLEQAITRLPECCRVPFVLADIESVPLDVVGEALALPTKTVRNRLHRARLLLCDALGSALRRTTGDNAAEDRQPLPNALPESGCPRTLRPQPRCSSGRARRTSGPT
jgi:RNA polymerase sigma-70 factor (ECF subfamily)